MEHLGPPFLPTPVLHPPVCRQDIGVLQIGNLFFPWSSSCLPFLLTSVCAHTGHVPVGQRDGCFLRSKEGSPRWLHKLYRAPRANWRGDPWADVSAEGQRASSLVVWITIHITVLFGLALPKTDRWVKWAKMRHFLWPYCGLGFWGGKVLVQSPDSLFVLLFKDCLPRPEGLSSFFLSACLYISFTLLLKKGTQFFPWFLIANI